MTGRPSTYTEEMGNLICDKLTEGLSLRKLCKSKEFPNASTVYVWLDRFPSFAEQYARAREAATEDMLEDILEIADNPEIEVQDKRVRIDTRKWAMGKLNMKKYGDNATLNLGNKNGEALKIQNEPVDPMVLSALTEALLSQKNNT
jgi:hypothetical protein